MLSAWLARIFQTFVWWQIRVCPHNVAATPGVRDWVSKMLEIICISCLARSGAIRSVGGPVGVWVRSDVAPRILESPVGGGLFLSGTSQPERSASRRHNLQPESIVLDRSATNTSSTQCEAGIAPRTAKAKQPQSGTRAKLTGHAFPPKNCVRPIKKAGARSFGHHCTITARCASDGSPWDLFEGLGEIGSKLLQGFAWEGLLDQPQLGCPRIQVCWPVRELAPRGSILTAF